MIDPSEEKYTILELWHNDRSTSPQWRKRKKVRDALGMWYLHWNLVQLTVGEWMGDVLEREERV